MSSAHVASRAGEAPRRPEPVALVTGSSTGIGAAVARRLRDGGRFVVVHSKSSTAAGEALARSLDGLYLRADLADEAEARALVGSVLERCGRLDVLVNNAAVSWRIPHQDLAAVTPAVWREILDVNLIAPWVLIQEAAPALAESPDGCIVNVSSHAGSRPMGSSIPYAVSKAALDHLTRLLAVALGPAVRVNAVAPGLVETARTAGWTEFHELWRERAPLRRAATPEDIAAVVAALVDTPYLTGDVVLADGGLHLR
jgi:NAD(P)-dependent dehydrogenase (short-subunit alcohol dehydrogenase family)